MVRTYCAVTWARLPASQVRGDAAEMQALLLRLISDVDFALIALTFEGAAMPGPPGDYNRDFVVDAADCVVWRKTDDAPDGYALWPENFGRVSGSSAIHHETPEPRSLLLVVLATLSGISVVARVLRKH
jgi:hypothetical protein